MTGEDVTGSSPSDAVTAAAVYRQALERGTQTQPPYDVDIGLRRLTRRMSGEIGYDPPSSAPATEALVGRLVYRMLLAVDIEKYSSIRGAREQFLIQADLQRVLDEAAERSGLDRRGWEREVRGDGELSVLPENVDAAQVVGRFTRELGEAIGALNREQPHRARLRVRLALHYGTLTPGPFGPAGDALIVVSRLLDAKPLRSYLAQRHDLDLALVVSASLYQDVVRTGFSSLDPHRFQPLRIKVKGTSYQGYTYAQPGEGALAREHALDLARALDAIPADVSGADLSLLDLSDVGELAGVTWSRETIWPPSLAARVDARSEEIGPGLYRIRKGGEHDPIDRITV